MTLDALLFVLSNRRRRVMSEAQSRVSPIVAIAAVALIIFSLVGVGVMTGFIPSSRSTDAEQRAAEAKAAQAQKAKPSQAATRANNPASAPKQAPAKVAVAEPAPAPVAAAPRICADCGVIDAISVIEQK